MRLMNLKKDFKVGAITHRLVLLTLLLLFTLHTHSQVTIGLGEEPVKGALLQVKNKTNVTDGSFNANRGLALPRVNLSEKKELYPMFLVDPEDPDSGANTDYDTNVKKEALDKLHTGLIVYNLKENDDKELCLGLNQWDGEQWNCFQEKMGNAIAHITNCDDITFLGQYFNDISLNSSNYMDITLEVTKAGAYTITARAAYAGDTSLDNGYYFTTTGVFLTTGTYTIQVPGNGTPLQYTPTANPGDVITITMNNKVLTLADDVTICNKNIKVEDSSKKPLYIMDCSKTKVKGVYKMDVPLDQTNFIEMVFDADISAVGAFYSIETNTVDGIYFKGEGLITGTTMNITLKGYGTPNSIKEKEFIITSNSTKTTATCEATVIVIIPKKRIYTLGHDAGFGYNLSTTSAARKVLTAPGNFGILENSKVKVDMPNFDFIVTGYNTNTANTNISAIRNELTNNKPDIVYITQDVYINSALATELISYLNKGGVLFFCWEANSRSATTFFSALFGNTIDQTSGGTGGGSIYKFNNINDEILNGPFGDVRNKYWGEDASWSIGLSNLPAGELDIYSYGNDYSNKAASETNKITGLPNIFKHKTLNLFFFSDGGFNSCPTGGPNTSSTICPFNYNTSTFEPIPKSGYGRSGSNFDVYNSQVWCNAMAWAIRQAQFKGINTK